MSDLRCMLIGHSRVYDHPHQVLRWGRWRTVSYARCRRCGTSDGCEVYQPGYWETFAGAMRRARYGWRPVLSRWLRQDCEDCGKPCVRFGREVGDHEKCDVIPF